MGCVNISENIQQKIEKTGKNYIRNMRICLVLAIAIFFGLFGLFCLLLGTPVGDWVWENGDFVWYDGWMFAMPILYILIVIIVVVFILVFYFRLQFSIQKKYMSVMFEECDAKRMLEESRCGIDYLTNAPNKRIVRYRMRAGVLLNFEMRYVQALIGCGRSREGLEYLEKHWQSKRNKVHLVLMQNVILNVAIEENNLESYQCQYEKAAPAIKKGAFFKAELMILQHKYEEALELMFEVKEINFYNNVYKSYVRGRCYLELGRLKDAWICFSYVELNGNTLAIQREASKIVKELDDKISSDWQEEDNNE